MATPSNQSRRTALPVLGLDPGPDEEPPADRLTATLQLRIGGQPYQLEMTVPSGPTRLRELLPVFEGLTNVVVAEAVQDVGRQGLTISCRAGCGACCRQVVPLTGAEAYRIAALVRALPEPRQAQVRERFEAARRQLAGAGLLDWLRHPGGIPQEQRPGLGLAYFQVGLACPFLEEESCSIHADRPLACREYLVTSPAENCARPAPETVHCVTIPVSVARAVREVETAESSDAPAWVPLTLALEWVEAHPETAPRRTGLELLQDLFARLSGSEPRTPTGGAAGVR
jgi:Fe-S-cluster containining protein